LPTESIDKIIKSKIDGLHEQCTSQISDEPGTKPHEQYINTHGSFAPGEQRRRHYNWESTGVDPVTHRFGAVDKNDIMNGVSKALDPGLDEEAIDRPVIVPKVVDDAKLVNGEVLGQPRRLGAGDRNQPVGRTFGKPSIPKV
jgi:EF-hand domain-containing family member B